MDGKSSITIRLYHLSITVITHPSNFASHPEPQILSSLNSDFYFFAIPDQRHTAHSTQWALR